MQKASSPFLIGIGASGSEGMNDICRLLNKWPTSLNAIVFAVLHRPSEMISEFASVLGRRSRIPVEIAGPGMTIHPGTCYVGMPSEILSLGENDSVVLLDGSNNRYRNRTIDLLFESMASSVGERAVGIVLSGALADGSRGLAAIHAAGGLTMVLDPGTKPPGMQQNAIDFDGPISFIGSSLDIAAVLQTL